MNKWGDWVGEEEISPPLSSLSPFSPSLHSVEQ